MARSARPMGGAGRHRRGRLGAGRRANRSRPRICARIRARWPAGMGAIGLARRMAMGQRLHADFPALPWRHGRRNVLGAGIRLGGACRHWRSGPGRRGGGSVRAILDSRNGGGVWLRRAARPSPRLRRCHSAAWLDDASFSSPERVRCRVSATIRMDPLPARGGSAGLERVGASRRRTGPAAAALGNRSPPRRGAAGVLSRDRVRRQTFRRSDLAFADAGGIHKRAIHFGFRSRCGQGTARRRVASRALSNGDARRGRDPGHPRRRRMAGVRIARRLASPDRRHRRNVSDAACRRHGADRMGLVQSSAPRADSLARTAGRDGATIRRAGRSLARLARRPLRRAQSSARPAPAHALGLRAAGPQPPVRSAARVARRAAAARSARLRPETFRPGRAHARMALSSCRPGPSPSR
ncbi:MAG: hypothetical protein BWZ10_01657 [candidate division BRC1 bacterium ADurb.BinA364]|nr:MAG: hypothetical protein BWZ10_01657 [candidate division BRC1 bacterium ADurb.BinA364]